MHFEIASACMKRILYWGQGGVCKPITSVIPVATQFRFFLFCFDKSLLLTFLQLLKKMAMLPKSFRLLWFELEGLYES